MAMSNAIEAVKGALYSQLLGTSLVNLVSAVWTIIKGWLDADQAKRTYMVSRKNVQDYIAEDQLLPHMIKKDKWSKSSNHR